MSEVTITEEKIIVTLNQFTADSVGPRGPQGIPGESCPLVFPYIDLDITADPAMVIGRTAWDTTDKTLKTMLSENVTLQHGQEMHIYCRNAQGAEIADGDIVYIYGSIGQTPTVKLADAIDRDKAVAVIGMATQHIADNGFGYVTTFGIVRGIDTDGFVEADLLYLSDTPGKITNVMPSYPSMIVIIGVCLFSNPSVGKIFFSPKIAFRAFGNYATGDYTEFLDDGTLKLVGDARSWRDETGDAIGIKIQGTGITINTAEAVTEYSATADLNDFQYKNVQLNHDRDLTEICFPHIHFFQDQNNVPNFILYYRYQLNGGPKTTAWTPIKCNTPALPYVSGTKNQIATTGTGITPPVGSGLSDIIQFKVSRDNANTSGLFSGADPFTGSVGVLSFDVHIHLDSFGSSSQYAK